MTVIGDLDIAGLLSAVAGAPDYAAATSLFVAELARVVGARRACMLHLDPTGQTIDLVASVGLGVQPGAVSIQTSDLSSPITISVLSSTIVRGGAALGDRAFERLAPWVAIPLARPPDRDALERLSREQASALAKSLSVDLVESATLRRGGVADGVVLLQGPIDTSSLERAARLAGVASPLLARLASLRDAHDAIVQLTHQRDDLALIVSGGSSEDRHAAEHEALKRFNGELESRVRESTAYLAEQNARLQWQAHEVERANKLKSEFLASMSHELRTPINALIGYSALLLDGVLGDMSPQQHDALARSRAAAEHLLALINDILDLAKIEAGKMPIHTQPVSLPDVTLEVTQQIEPMVRKKELEFVIDVAPDCPVIYSDATKIRQVLLNLLSNAVKFTSRGRVTVAVRPAPSAAVRIDVVDTGIGIRSTDLQSIWEDFRQVDQSRTREFGGTGLGLSITRKLVDRLGGSVTVQSSYGVGSTFSVFLPERAPARNTPDYEPIGMS